MLHSCWWRTIITIIVFSISPSCTAQSSNGVANIQRNGSRFGDHLLGYCKAKWVAFKYEMPFYLKPFQYSNELILSRDEEIFNAQTSPLYKNKIYVQGKPINWSQHHDTLYYISFCSKNIDWSISRTDKQFTLFREELRTKIYPKKEPAVPTVPSDMISVAVHVRKGGGFDKPLLSRKIYADQRWPLKFPPNRFYIDHIRYLYNYFGQQPLYVFIFTDDKQPTSIVKIFADALADCQLQFDCRKTTNSHTLHVVDDLIGLSVFDCLIRPNSSFSTCAQLIGRHQIVIWPTDYHWDETTLIIDEVTIHMPSRHIPSCTTSLCKNITCGK